MKNQQFTKKEKVKMITVKKKILLLAVLAVIATTSIATLVIEEIYYAYKYESDLEELYTWDLISEDDVLLERLTPCLLYTSPSPRDQRGSRIAACG